MLVEGGVRQTKNRHTTTTDKLVGVLCVILPIILVSGGKRLLIISFFVPYFDFEFIHFPPKKSLKMDNDDLETSEHLDDHEDDVASATAAPAPPAKTSSSSAAGAAATASAAAAATSSSTGPPRTKTKKKKRQSKVRLVHRSHCVIITAYSYSKFRHDFVSWITY